MNEPVEVIDEVNNEILVFSSNADADEYGLTGDEALIVGRRVSTF